MSTYPLLEVAGAGSAQAKLDEDTQCTCFYKEKNQKKIKCEVISEGLEVQSPAPSRADMEIRSGCSATGISQPPFLN